MSLLYFVNIVVLHVSNATGVRSNNFEFDNNCIIHSELMSKFDSHFLLIIKKVTGMKSCGYDIIELNVLTDTDDQAVRSTVIRVMYIWATE